MEKKHVFIVAPARVASVNSEHTNLANSCAAYECDGWNRDPNTYSLRKGQTVLVCGVAPWYHVGGLPKAQRRFGMEFNGKKYSYDPRVAREHSPRMFWECHFGRGVRLSADDSGHFIRPLDPEWYSALDTFVCGLRLLNTVHVSCNKNIDSPWTEWDTGALEYSQSPIDISKFAPLMRAIVNRDANSVSEYYGFPRYFLESLLAS